MAVFGQSVTFRDDKGQTATVRFFVNNTTQALAATSAALVVTALAACSNAAVQAVRGPSNMSPTALVYGTDAEFEDIEDKAVFVFETAAGSIHRYMVPAPKASMFNTDGETIDFSQTEPDALRSQMIGQSVCSRDGNVLTISIGGTRLRKPQQRKFSVITRNPALTGQGL